MNPHPGRDAAGPPLAIHVASCGRGALAALLIVATPACVGQIEAGHGPTRDATPSVDGLRPFGEDAGALEWDAAPGSTDARPRDAAPARDAWTPARDAGPASDAAPGPQPSGAVQWLAFPTQHSQTDPTWGTVLTDIVQHCPASWVGTYYDSDKITHGHETTHGVHAFLRNNYNDTGVAANGLYVLENRAAIIEEPHLRKSQVADYVPSVLRGTRYSLYVTGQTAWDDTPLYLWDEWVAYANGTAVAVDLYDAGKWTYGWRGACDGTIEFVGYAIAVGMAVEQLDPAYFAGYAQFKEFLAWHLQRSMDLFHACRVIPDFSLASDDETYATLRTDPAVEPMREFLRRTFGAAFMDDLLGL